MVGVKYRRSAGVIWPGLRCHSARPPERDYSPGYQAVERIGRESTPINIKVMIRRCIEKDVKKRLQFMADAVIEINETLHLPKIAPPLTSSGGSITSPVSKRQLLPY